MRKRTDPQGRGTVVVAESAWGAVAFCVACGVGLGWLVPLLADWLVSLPWAPLEGPAELLHAVPEPGRTLGALAVGAVLGLVVGCVAVHESLSVRVSGTHVGLTIRDEERAFPRSEVAHAVRDGKQLVILGPTGAELAREDCGLPWDRLAQAFTGHGYRWADEDPHRDEFRRWVPGAAGLPEGANALLHARARALRTNDDASDARELRAELVRLGVVVRDEKGRQYWRLPRGL
ncbi:YqeB family protein [Streptomyces phaeofaciens]|uniref:YqeB family protein n=1 Tax=Streptomyces phaeofaciens TaxID=68254 RepID=UPI0036B0D1B8